MTEAQARAADVKRAKHKEYADRVGLSEYKVAKYGKKFLEDNPLVLESLVLVHKMTGYYNVSDDVMKVRREIAKAQYQKKSIEKQTIGNKTVKCLWCDEDMYVGKGTPYNMNRKTCSDDCKKQNAKRTIINFRNKNKNK